MYLNKALIAGNLTRDPEMKSLPSGSKVTTFSVATNRVYKDANGQKKEETEYHNIVVFGRQAETSAEYLKKGQQVMIEGRIVTRSWEDANGGGKKYRTEIIADGVQFGSRSGSTGDYNNNQESKSDTAASSNNKDEDMGSINYGETINPDDIPF
ncbi:MAG: single-strand DNA-binding protein [Patescibacteria group bacterium]|nr:single-strand DNA-binding protein [Patescibacteria group bacterium]